jgi:hypothetical protein
MPRRPLAPADAESSERSTRIEIARTQLFDVDVDRKKRIDDAIDYFGAGQRAPNRTTAGDQGPIAARADVH